MEAHTPIYFYKCPQCGTTEEVLVKSAKDHTRPLDCFWCNAPMEKQPTAAVPQFKGAGWTGKG